MERRSRHELAKRRARAHVLEGLLKALSRIDEVIRCIRASADADAARSELTGRFDLDEQQANAILEMQLRRLAALEQQKLQDEYDEVLLRIAWLEEVLASGPKGWASSGTIWKNSWKPTVTNAAPIFFMASTPSLTRPTQYVSSAY